MNNSKKFWYIKYDKYNSNEYDLKIKLIAQGTPRFKEKDNIIIMEDSTSTFAFVGYGIISQINIKRGEKNKTITNLKIEDIKPLQYKYDLYDFAYSLPRIYKYYENPDIHFRRNYGRLSPFEYKVIINADIFITRTAFGKLFHSMHIEHRKTFMRIIENNKPELIYNKIKDYVELFDLLKEYIDTNIIKPFEMLKKSNNILKEELDVKEKIGFSNPNDIDNINSNKNIDYIDDQISSVGNMKEYLNYWNYLKDNIKKFKESDIKKNKYFNDKCLPVNIK